MVLFLDSLFCLVDLYVHPFTVQEYLDYWSFIISLEIDNIAFQDFFLIDLTILVFINILEATCWFLLKNLTGIYLKLHSINGYVWGESLSSVQFSSVTQSCPTLCNPMDCCTPGLPVHQQLLEFTQTHVHWVSDAIQPSHPLLPLSPPAFDLAQHQGLFQRVSCSHQVARVLKFQLEHQSFQWIFRTDFL